MPKTVDLHVRPVLDAPTVRPGDTLIIRVETGTDPGQVVAFRDQVAGRLPGVHVVVIAAEQLAVYRPDDEPGA